MSDFEIKDMRGASRSSIAEANLRNRGFALPKSASAARQAIAETQASVDNRTLTAAMRRTGSVAGGGGMTRTGANTQMVLPKRREPMSSLKDKNIPFDTTKPNELKEIRKWARLFYATHDLVPLLIDIYSKFPLQGLEFNSKDPKLKEFYDDVFLNGLDYEEFLQDFGREYFISGEVNTLGHFDETLGVWSAEEILNPDSLAISKSMFVRGERVQLLVADMINNLRESMSTSTDDEGTRSEKLERSWEYQQIVENYPEMIEAANSGDGLDIDASLISRVVNKVQPWDLRGTPHLLRSFRTLLMEESLNQAQDAVADRLYSPFILATLGIANLGDNEPWIPDQADLDETRDTMQDALAADFRLMVHNFGLDIKSVFGRESVPRFDQDYQRIDKKLMSAWGIGEALISGSSASTYAGSALNREFVTQMMSTFQKAIKKHIRKRCEVIAEAQEHFDYELSGGVRKPIFREIVETDEEGYTYTRKVPKLLIPDISMSTLNLRDEAQERSFLQTLRNSGVPISDKSLAVNIPIEFTEELEAQSEEKVQKLVAEAQAMDKAAKIIEQMGLPVPPDLAKYLSATPQLKAVQTGTDQAETEAETAETKHKVLQETGTMPGEEPATNIVAPGQPAAIDPATGQPALPPGGGAPAGGPPGAGGGVPPGLDGGGSSGGSGDGIDDGSSEEGNPFGLEMDNGLEEDLLDNSDAQTTDRLEPLNQPILDFGDGKGGEAPAGGEALPQRNRSRPEESDEMRKTMPKKSSLGAPPSSVGSSHNATEARIEAAMRRLAATDQTIWELVANDEFFETLNRQSYIDQVRNDADALRLAVNVDNGGRAHLAERGDHGLTETFEVLCEMAEQYQEIYGYHPEW